MEHYNVIIMTPGYSMENRYVHSLLNTIRELESRGITWAYSSVSSSDVAIARESTVLGRSLQLPTYKKYESPLSGLATYDKLFLIDSDIFWEVSDFIRLYESEYDAISGVYLQSDGETTTTFVEPSGKDNKTPFISNRQVLRKEDIRAKSTPFKITGSGLGFMCIKKGVFEKVERPWFKHVVEEFAISESEVNVEMLSEDLSFIQRVRKAGINVYADPTILVGHSKKTNVHWY